MIAAAQPRRGESWLGLPARTAGNSFVPKRCFGFLNTATYSAMTTAKLFGTQLESSPDWSDKCFYGILPMIAYLGLAAAAGAVWLAPKSAPYVVAAIMLVLLLIGIRNAWDLATFFVQRMQKPEK